MTLNIWEDSIIELIFQSVNMSKSKIINLFDIWGTFSYFRNIKQKTSLWKTRAETTIYHLR